MWGAGWKPRSNSLASHTPTSGLTASQAGSGLKAWGDAQVLISKQFPSLSYVSVMISMPEVRPVRWLPLHRD